ncbi:aprataxin-like protein [Sticta canariensis]|nr:aprataxin-like protein [Sticta canariensis]
MPVCTPTPRSISPFTFLTKSPAVSVLMSSRKPKSPTHSESLPTTQTSTFSSRNGLGAYIANPASYPSSRVITHSDAFVTIHDLFPKSSIHLLLLPRDPTKNLQDPFTALDDPVFCAQVQAEVRKLRVLVAKELKRRFGGDSALEQRREQALEKGEDGEEEAHEGRDWSLDVMAGIHARPSMNHLHVHILSRDFRSDCMRHRKHYNSFHTRFFIDINEFPLAKDDPRRHPGGAAFLDEEFRCWRCGKEFGKRFAALKRHLEDEFEDWKKV